MRLRRLFWWFAAGVWLQALYLWLFGMGPDPRFFALARTTPYIAFAAMAVLAPIFEEIAFRGVVWRVQQAIMSEKHIPLTNALFFALVHAPDTSPIYGLLIIPPAWLICRGRAQEGFVAGAAAHIGFNLPQAIVQISYAHGLL